LHLVANNNFLILPLARAMGQVSTVPAQCSRQLPEYWERRYGYSPLLLQTLVDARRFTGNRCRAANWLSLTRNRGA